MKETWLIIIAFGLAAWVITSIGLCIVASLMVIGGA